jgi:uncharacterized phage protein gp47/JayE
MPWVRDSLDTVTSRIISELGARTQGRAFIKRSLEAIFGNSFAGTAHELWGTLEWSYKQLFPQHADIDGLLNWGEWLEVERKGGALAQGEALATGADGSVIAAGKLLQSSDGALFSVVTGGTIASGEATIVVRAVAAGLAGNLDADETLAFLETIPGVDVDVIVVDGLSGGTDIEDPEDYRPRVITGLRTPYPTGSEGDYVTWALEVEGVTRAWEFPKRMGPGTVSLGFVMDEREDIIPLDADVAAVQAYLDARMPLDMRLVSVTKPIPTFVRIIAEVSGTMDTADVLDALEAFVRAEARLELPLERSQFDEIISLVPGETSHTITSIAIAREGDSEYVEVEGSEVDPGVWGLLVLQRADSVINDDVG